MQIGDNLRLQMKLIKKIPETADGHPASVSTKGLGRNTPDAQRSTNLLTTSSFWAIEYQLRYSR
ncbi:hypothetical protein SCG7086_AS_00230 [Chlamydiales bacterium SCGC AG-110-P3]|nr:hypothetical protein SCG7086_AS_00230 [Chlamydiales bacterium SCGC AG-110-P3]